MNDMTKTLVFSKSPINIFGSIYQKLYRASIKVLMERLPEKAKDGRNVYKIEMKRVRNKGFHSGVFLGETVVFAHVKAEFPIIAKEALAWLLIETAFGDDFSKILNVYNMESIKKYIQPNFKKDMIHQYGPNGSLEKNTKRKEWRNQVKGWEREIPLNLQGQSRK